MNESGLTCMVCGHFFAVSRTSYGILCEDCYDLERLDVILRGAPVFRIGLARRDSWSLPGPMTPP